MTGMAMRALDHVKEAINSIRSIQIRHVMMQLITLAIIVSLAVIMWKGLICCTGTESPVVVVLSESMEPAFQRGDILFLYMDDTPVKAGDIVVFNIDGKKIPIVHRIIKVHQDKETNEVEVLTKGDNNPDDDRYGIYARGQGMLSHKQIVGRAVGFLPYAGWLTILMTDKPYIKYVVIGVLGLLVIAMND